MRLAVSMQSGAEQPRASHTDPYSYMLL